LHEHVTEYHHVTGLHICRLDPIWITQEYALSYMIAKQIANGSNFYMCAHDHVHIIQTCVHPFLS